MAPAGSLLGWRRDARAIESPVHGGFFSEYVVDCAALLGREFEFEDG